MSFGDEVNEGIESQWKRLIAFCFEITLHWQYKKYNIRSIHTAIFKAKHEIKKKIITYEDHWFLQNFFGCKDFTNNKYDTSFRSFPLYFLQREQLVGAYFWNSEIKLSRELILCNVRIERVLMSERESLNSRNVRPPHNCR